MGNRMNTAWTNRRRLWGNGRLASIRTFIALTLVFGLAGDLVPHVVAAAPPTSATAVAVSANEVDVSWDGISPSSAPNIGISRGGRRIGIVKTALQSFVDKSIQPGTSYTYDLESADANGNSEGQFASVSVRTPDLPETSDVMPPSEPEGFSATTAVGRGVYLDWYASVDDSDVTAYRIFRNGVKLVTLDSGNLSYVDPTAAVGHFYIYAIQAFDVVGNHSKFATAGILVTRSLPVPPGGKTNGGYGPTTNALTTPASVSAAPGVPTGYDPALRRYPYLSDTVANYATINWATDQSDTAGSVKYGQVVNGSCTPTTSVDATRTSLTINGVHEFQWKAQLTLTPGSEYCYRIYLGSTDLLGSNSTPSFNTAVPNGSNQSFSFAVIGDWAQLDSTGANPDMANLMQQIAASNARFAVTVGDNGYPSGTQANYGDLQQTGSNTSAVFGPQFWAVPGSSIPIFPAIGNHGYSSSASPHPQILNFPMDQAAALSSGSYTTTNYCCVNGIKSANYPNAWYAFDEGVARFYVLEAAWPDSNVGNASMYQDDHDYHWTISSEEYQWLQQDLATHPRAATFAFFHFPLYSDNATEPTDPYLQAPGNLQGLLDQYGVNIAFYGHTHTYQRNTADSAGMVSYLTGGGGAKLEPVGAGSAKCSPNDAYAVGWSYSANGGLGGGKACGSASAPTSPSQVFHFLLVTVGNGTVTVTPTDSTGQVFDQQTYNVGSSDTQAPTTPANLQANAHGPNEVDLNWNASTDDVGVAGYTIYRDGTVLATVDGTASTYVDTTVSAGTTYTYTVDAFDAAGNHSAQSDAASVTPSPDNQAPTVPGNLTVTTPTALRVNVSWSASTDNIGVTGYDVYRDGTKVGTVDGATTTYTDVLVNPSTSYSYQVLAFDGSGNSSSLTSPAGITTPGAVFQDGFESGSLSSWTTTKGLTVEGSTVHAGNKAAEASSDSSNTTGTYAKKTLANTYNEVYFHSSINVVSEANQLNVMRIRTASGSSLGYLYVTTSGTLGLHNDTTGTNTLSSATIMAGSGWHSIALHVKINGASSTTEVWLDGVPVAELALTADWGTTSVGQIQIGDTASGRTYDVIYDDVALDPLTGDTQPPTTPANVTAQAANSLRVNVAWDAATDNVGVTGYDVYRDGSLIARNVAQTNFSDVLISPNSNYSYQVLARDASGNVSSLSTSVSAATSGSVFSDGFETGNLSNWTTSNGLAIESASVHNGTAAAEANALGSSAYAKAFLSNTYGDVYLREYVNLINSSNQVSILRLRDQNGASIGYLYLTAGGKLGLHNDVAGTNLSSSESVAAGSGWHAIEIHLAINGNSSSADVWLDGVAVPELTGTGNWGTAPVGQIQIGDTSSGTYDIVYDDVAFDGSLLDVTPPSVPADLTATPNGPSEVDLTWTASTDDVGVSGYTIYRNGTSLATVDGTTTSYQDTTVSSGNDYSYTVDAFDAAGNHSNQSAPATISQSSDTTPPTVPTGLATTTSALRIDLTWTASTDSSGVDSYDVYRDGTKIAQVAGDQTSYTDVLVGPGGSYSYQVLARDTVGNVSVLSDAAAAFTGTAVFSDGFESGNLSAWSTNKGMNVQGTVIHNGSEAAETLSDSSNTTGTYAKKTLSSSFGQGYLRSYINIQSIGNNQINLLRLRTAGGTSLGYLYVTSSGKLGLRNDIAGINVLSNSSIAPGSGWHAVELHLVVNGASSTTEVWLDGVLVPELTTTGNWGTTIIGQIQIGDTLTARTYDVVYDDVAFDGS